MVPFYCVCGAFPPVTSSGEILSDKWPPSKFVTLRKQNVGKTMFLQGKKGISREWIFSPLSIKNCLDSKMWGLQSYPEDLTCRVRAVCFPALAQAFNHIPTSSQNCPWGNRLLECVQTTGCHTVVTQVRWHSIANRPSAALASHLLASEIPKVGQKRSLSEVKKKSNCMDFLAVANLAIKVRYPLSDSGGVSAVSTHISQRPRLTGCSYRENVMG